MIPELDLEHAQHYYGLWILDSDDLRVINRERQKFYNEHGTLCIHTTELQDWLRSPFDLDGRIRQALWYNARRE